MSVIGCIGQRCKYVSAISDGAPWFPGALSGRLPRLLVKSAPGYRPVWSTIDRPLNYYHKLCKLNNMFIYFHVIDWRKTDKLINDKKNIKYNVKYTVTCSDVGVLLLYSGACGWDWCVCLSLFLIRSAPYMMSIWSNQMFIVYFYHRYEIKTLNMM